MELLNVGIADILMRASKNDDRFHIATVKGVSMDELNILAPNCGLFDSRCSPLKEEIWKQRLHVVFRRIYATDENGSQEATRSIDQILRFADGWEQERHRAFQQVIVDDNINDIQRLF